MEEETTVMFNVREVRKLEYLLRQRILHLERRIEKRPEDIAPKNELVLLDSLQDKLERARLKL